MKKILPFNTPMINHIPTDAVRLSILQAYEDYLPIVHNFCNVFSFEVLTNKNEKVLDTQFFWNIPEIVQKLIPRFFIKDIVLFIQEALQYDYYVNICVDSSKIQEYCYYNDTKFFFHQIAIYGYNTEEKIFYCADFFGDNGFRTAVVSFESLLRAYNSMQQEIPILNPLTGAADWVMDIELLKPLIHYRQSLNIELIYKSIENFMNGLNINGYSAYTRTRPHVMTKENAEKKSWLYEANVLSEVYGIDVFTLIRKYFILSEQDGAYTLNIKMCYLFYAYHRLMLFRIMYLAEQNISVAARCGQLSSQYRQLMESSRLLTNLFIRYQVTQRAEFRIRLEEKIESNITTTILLLREFLNILQ